MRRPTEAEKARDAGERERTARVKTAEQKVASLRDQLRQMTAWSPLPGQNWGPIRADGSRALASQRAKADNHARLTRQLEAAQAELAEAKRAR